MATALQTTDKTPISAIRFSATSIALVERISDNLDSDYFDAMHAQAGQGAMLRQAADEHRDLLVPASPDFVRKTLSGLRSGTKVTNETEAEAVASFNLLHSCLSDVPADILREACRRYVNVPGVRFFPRSAGELRAFINPLIHQRQMREYRLRKLAEAADFKASEAERLAKVEEMPIDEIRGMGMARGETMLGRGWITQAQFDEAFPDASAAGTEEER